MSGGVDSTLEGGAALAPREREVSPERYAIGEELARGGLGRILKAYDRRLERPVAIKELLGPEPSSAARFAIEALLTARLEHPNIVPVHDVGRMQGGQAFYAMKLVQGRSLAEALAERGTTSARLELLAHLVDVADAIAYAHSRGVVHRDLKPQNVLIGSFGETVVIDWGVAKLLGEAGETGGGSDSGALDPHTMAGSILGTPEYMAPEQAMGAPADRRFDVYGIGAMLYHLMTGAPPLVRTPGPIREQVLAGPRARIGELVKDAPPELVAIAERAMAKDPSARYASAAELAQELKRYRDGQRVAAYAYTAREILMRWVKRWRLAIAAAAVALVSLVAALVVVAIDRGALADALKVAEQREADAERREGAAVTREGAALKREGEAVERADDLRVGQARFAAEREPRGAMSLLAGLSPGFADLGRARVIAAEALSHPTPRLLGRLEGARYELAIAPDGTQLTWARGDGEVRRLRASGASETRASLPAAGTAVAYAPDGKAVAVGDSTGDVLLLASEGDAPGTKLIGHTSQIEALAFSPDGKHLVAAAVEADVRLWDVASGAVQVLPGAGRFRFTVAWSPDGKTLAVSDPEGIVLHDVAGGAPPKRFEVLPFVASLAVFSPDGRVLFMENTMGQVVRLDLVSGAHQTIVDNGGSVGLSPDGKTLAVVYASGVIELLDATTLAATGKLACGSGAWAATFDDDGRHMVVAARDALCVFATGSWKREILVGHEGGILNRYHATKSGAVAAVDSHGRLLLHEPGAGAWRAPLEIDARAPVRTLAFAPGRHLVAAASMQELLLIDADSGHEEAAFDFKSGRSLAFSADGRVLAACGINPAIGLYEVATRSWRELNGGGPCYQVSFTPDGTRLAAAGRDGAVRLFSRDGAFTIAATFGAPVRAAAWSHDGDSLAMLSDDQHLLVQTPEGELDFDVPWHLCYGVSFSEDDQRVAVAGDEGYCAWELASGKRLACGNQHGPVLPLFTRDGGSLIVASALGAAIVPLDTGRSPRELGGHRQVLSTALSPEGERLVTSDVDGLVRLWHRESGEGRLLAQHPGGPVLAIGFSSDGTLVASAGWDGQVRVTRDDLPLEAGALRQRLVELGNETR